MATDAPSQRSGRYEPQPQGYRAFIPAPLPPDPPLNLTVELTGLLAEANQALGRLDGATQILPDQDLFVWMYMRKEAVFSSQIEGTQSSLERPPCGRGAHVLRLTPTRRCRGGGELHRRNEPRSRVGSPPLPVSVRLDPGAPRAAPLEGTRDSERRSGQPGLHSNEPETGSGQRAPR